MKAWMLALLAGNSAPTVVTLTSSNTSYTVPHGVNRLESVVGYGGDTVTRLVLSVGVTYSATGTGVPGSGPATWDSLQGQVSSNLSSMGAGGSPTIQQSSFTAYPDGTTSAVSSNSATLSDVIAGTAAHSSVDGWSTTGPITASGTAAIRYQETGPATTGFGFTFPGSTGSPVTPVQHNGVAVTGGTSYPLSIPAGGSITITYYL